MYRACICCYHIPTQHRRKFIGIFLNETHMIRLVSLWNGSDLDGPWVYSLLRMQENEMLKEEDHTSEHPNLAEGNYVW